MLLPTPDMPTSACVRPGASRARRPLTPQPSRAESTIASAPVASETAAVSATGSRARSPFVQTIRTSTPPARASATKRSSRRRLRSMSSEVVTRHRSTLAASASSRASSSARASSVRRGSTWRIDLAAAQRDPVARRGQVGGGAGGALQRARDRHERFDVVTADGVEAAVHCGHARGDERVVFVVGEGLGPSAVPPEGGEVQL